MSHNRNQIVEIVQTPNPILYFWNPAVTLWGIIKRCIVNSSFQSCHIAVPAFYLVCICVFICFPHDYIRYANSFAFPLGLDNLFFLPFSFKSSQGFCISPPVFAGKCYWTTHTVCSFSAICGCLWMCCVHGNICWSTGSNFLGSLPHTTFFFLSFTELVRMVMSGWRISVILSVRPPIYVIFHFHISCFSYLICFFSLSAF